MVLAKDDDKKPNIHTIVLPKYYDYLKIFEKANTNKFPLHCPSNHTILLMDGFKPPFGPLYSLSYPEFEELKCWLDKTLSKGFICTSPSPTAAPILFVKKGDSLLRLVIDYRGINEGTIKNRYPLPLLQDTLMILKGQIVYEIGYLWGIQFNSHSQRPGMENRILHSLWFIRIISYALWSHQYPGDIPKLH
jgi:hypothetical protein